MSEEMQKPKLHSLWVNKKSGAIYQVYDITNEASDRLEEYPVRISYRRIKDNTTWSRSLSDWHRSYRELDVSAIEWTEFAPQRVAP